MRLASSMSPRVVRRGTRGYVLLELLVTAVILSGGILFLVDSMRQSLGAARRAHATEQALAVGEEVVLGLLEENDEGRRPTDGERVIGETPYFWQLEEVSPVYVDGVKSEVWLVQLTVTWPETKKHCIKLPFLWRSDEASSQSQVSPW